MKVAAVQFCPVFRGVHKNIETGSALVRAAASHGAELIVLPELSTCGYSFLNDAEARPCAENAHGDSPSKRAYMTLAKELGVAIAWGLMTVDSLGALHNSQGFALPDGRFIVYDKVNPWGNDFLWATKGRESPPIVEYKGKKIGLLICRDVRDTANGFKDFYEPGDADIVCFSSNWGDGGFPSGNWVDFSVENRCWLIVSNRYGREVNNNFGEGGICVIEPSGKIHCDGVLWSQPCIVYAEVP